MNPLDNLKQKLMVKPNVQEREPIAVIIKRNKQDVKGVEVNETKEIEKKELVNVEKPKPIIVDETEKGYDRNALLKKLAESKKLKVSVKPNLDTEAKKVIDNLPGNSNKRAKKLEVKPQLIIEDEEEMKEGGKVF